MEKQKKQMIGMLVLLLLLVAAYFGVRYYNDAKVQEETEQEEASRIKITEISVDDICYLSYDVDGTVYSYTRDGESWSWDADTSLDLEESQVETLLQAVASLDATTEIDTYDSLADYGLENPTKTVTIQTEDTTVTFYLGTKNAITGGYYLKCADSDTVYLVEKDLASTFTRLPQDMELVIEETEESTETLTESTEALIESTEE